MLIPMQSEIIEAVSYNADARTLFVQLRTGDAYSYSGVPAQVFRRFAVSDSPGAFFNRVIKRFECRPATDSAWPGGEPFG